MFLSALLSDREAEAERLTTWVLAHPGVARWVKACDPVVASNDVEMLREVLRTRAEAIADRWLRVPGCPTPLTGSGESA